MNQKRQRALRERGRGVGECQITQVERSSSPAHRYWLRIKLKLRGESVQSDVEESYLVYEE